MISNTYKFNPLEFAATGRQLQQSTKKSTFLPVEPVYNPRESRKTIVNQSHSRVKMFNNLDAEFYYKNIENMVREQKVEYFISDFD